MSGNRNWENQDSNSKVDPAAFLDDESMICVLSFLWYNTKNPFDKEGENKVEDLTTIAVFGANPRILFAFKQHLSLLSTKWKALLNRIIARIAPMMRLDYDEIPQRQWGKQTKMLCRHPDLSFKSLRCPEFGASGFCSEVIRSCKVEHVESCTIRIWRSPSNYLARMMCAPDMEELSILYSAQRIQEDLAAQCPRLEFIVLLIGIESNGINIEGDISPAMFCHVNVQHVTITLRVGEEVDSIDFCLLSKVIQNLPCLEKLSLAGLGCFTPSGYDSFEIRSKSLKILDVAELPSVCLTLNCPKLCMFYFKGGTFQNQYERETIMHFVRQKVVRGLNLPEDCDACMQSIVEGDCENFAFKMLLSFLLGLDQQLVPAGRNVLDVVPAGMINILDQPGVRG